MGRTTRIFSSVDEKNMINLYKHLLASQSIHSQIKQLLDDYVAQHPEWEIQDSFIDSNNVITRR